MASEIGYLVVPCKHDFLYQQKLPDHEFPSAPSTRDNGNTNIRTCRRCGLVERKEWV